MMSVTLPKEIQLVRYNQLDVLEIVHPKCTAKVALQGAHLFSWQPAHAKQDVLWLSEVEPFETGVAIRGGVPICYPWFGGVKQPAHGTARINLWQLLEAEVLAEQVNLTFAFGDQAQIRMELGETCLLTFTHLGSEPVQLALHSYFNVANIEQVALGNLPTSCFNSLTQQQHTVSSPRLIDQNVDEIYKAELSPSIIQDQGNQREIQVEHLNASDIVVWNPWHREMSGMSKTGYQTMVCVETARIYRLLSQGEKVATKFNVDG